MQCGPPYEEETDAPGVDTTLSSRGVLEARHLAFKHSGHKDKDWVTGLIASTETIGSIVALSSELGADIGVASAIESIVSILLGIMFIL